MSTSKNSSSSNKFVVACAAAGSGLIARDVCDSLVRWWYNYPPGTNGLPIVGCLPYILDDRYFDYLHKKYGPVAMIQFCQKNLIVINDVTLCKQLYNKEEFMKHDYKFGSKKYENFGSINGEKMKFRRKIFHSSFGILSETKYLKEYVLKCCQNTIFPFLSQISIKGKNNNNNNNTDISDNINCNSNMVIKFRYQIEYSMFSIIFYTIFGSKYLILPSIDSIEYKLFRDNLRGYMDNAQMAMMRSCFGVGFLNKRENRHAEDMHHQVRIWIDKFIENYTNIDADTNTDIEECFTMSSMIKQVKLGSLTKENMVGDIGVLFLAGLSTLLDAMYDCIDYISYNNELQEKLRQEALLNVNKNITECHKIRAFVYEVARLMIGKPDVAIQGALRTIMDDGVTINTNDGNIYNIPKGSILVANYCGFALSKEYGWPHDDKITKKIEIDHFIDKQTGFFKHNPAFSRFGFGKRNCPGKSVAIRELMLFMATILKKYKFYHCKNNQLVVVQL